MFSSLVQGSHHTHHSLSDLPNRGVPENSFQLPEQRTGKKGKRHKNASRLVEGKFDVASSEKENYEGTYTDNNLRERVKFHNNQDAKNG